MDYNLLRWFPLKCLLFCFILLYAVTISTIPNNPAQVFNNPGLFIASFNSDSQNSTITLKTRLSESRLSENRVYPKQFLVKFKNTQKHFPVAIIYI